MTLGKTTKTLVVMSSKIQKYLMRINYDKFGLIPPSDMTVTALNYRSDEQISTKNQSEVGNPWCSG